MALSEDFKIDRPLSITLRLPRKFAKDGIFPTRGIVLQSVLDVVKDKKLIYCFQRLSASHYDITFVDDAQEARDLLLEAGITIQGVHLPLFESDPKTTIVTVKNLPAEIEDEILTACLSTYGEVLSVTKVLDDDEIWIGDRTVEMVIKSDIPSLIRLGTYPIYIRNRWGHAVSDCPYKKHSLCIRCGSAGHTARYCSHPWILDNSPVTLSDLNFTPVSLRTVSHNLRGTFQHRPNREWLLMMLRQLRSENQILPSQRKRKIKTRKILKLSKIWIPMFSS